MRNTPLLIAWQNLLFARSRVVEHCYSQTFRPHWTTVRALAFFETPEIGRYRGLAGKVEQYGNDPKLCN
jgi:hypothetical protein